MLSPSLGQKNKPSKKQHVIFQQTTLHILHRYALFFNVVFHHNTTLKHILNALYIFNFHLQCVITVNTKALILMFIH
jgi:hypothetical protein